METTYYTFTAREILVSGDGVKQAVGGARRLALARRPAAEGRLIRRDNVVDLAAWRAAREEEQAGEAWEEDLSQVWAPAPAVQPRPRRDHRSRILYGGELLASLSVVGVMVLLVIRILGG